MKIGFDAKRAFLNESGLGTYSRNILIGLRKYFPENEYLLFTPEIRQGIFPEQDQFDIYSPDNPASKIMKSLWRTVSLSKILDKHRIDLFHGLSHEIPAGIHKTKVSSVVTIHDLIFLRFPQFYKPVDRKIYLHKLQYSTKYADKVIAISKQTRDDLINYLKVPEEKIEVVYQGIYDRFFKRMNDLKRNEVLKRNKLPEKYILSLGTLESRKNHIALLKAIKSGNIDIPIVFVGRATLFVQKILDFISKNEMEKRVFFRDKIIDEDLPYIYNGAELMVYISLFEGFGLPVVESMASGCPVLASNTSCLPEVSGEATLLCDPENIDDIQDKINQLLTNKQLRNELIKKGQERAQMFTSEKSVKSLMDVYNQVVKYA